MLFELRERNFFFRQQHFGGRWGEMTCTSAARDTFHDRNSTMRLVPFNMELDVSEYGRGGWGREGLVEEGQEGVI